METTGKPRREALRPRLRNTRARLSDSPLPKLPQTSHYPNLNPWCSMFIQQRKRGGSTSRAAPNGFVPSKAHIRPIEEYTSIPEIQVQLQSNAHLLAQTSVSPLWLAYLEIESELRSPIHVNRGDAFTESRKAYVNRSRDAEWSWRKGSINSGSES